MDCGLLKGQCCLSDQVSHRLTMFTGKDVDPLSRGENDMVPDRTGTQVRVDPQLLHRVCLEPFVLLGYAHRIFRDLFRVCYFRVVMMYDGQALTTVAWWYL